jgi:protoporphyrinogen oxidase
MISVRKVQVAIVGGGFTGLAAAYELSKSGIEVAVLESEPEIGGLAAAFNVEGERLDRFYHHWFTNDLEVMNLIDELGLRHRVEINPTNTGVYYANNFFKLSTPWDLLNFSPLNFIDRIRLGLLALRARRVKNWRSLESKTAHQWLKELGGENVYRVVWQPLLKGKFGPFAEEISAVWFWNKLKLRGGSRGKKGEEQLAYFKGGFISLAESLAQKIRDLGGSIAVSSPVTSVKKIDNNWCLEFEDEKTLIAEHVIFTTALPIVAKLIESWAASDYLDALRRIKYIGNVCLVLQLKKSLSSTYWLNVNDPTFPFVGVIEHTNFERPETYGGHHIVYLSKYLPHTDPLYSMNREEFLEYALPFIKKMFPQFDRSWINDFHLWRARWSQPVVERHYSQLIPSSEGPLIGMHLCSMAQIYPEDRGTNYAVREGRNIAKKISQTF